MALFARTAGVTVLASDDAVLSPYRTVTWSPEGERSLVLLDERALDEDDAYVLLGAAPDVRGTFWPGPALGADGDLGAVTCVARHTTPPSAGGACP
ncbi:hypothetical protein [Streptomyces sp. NPDC007088]|uniref:hypothetical protein n=1 Tax=Streptomyces sp. NPDC007088 TaxID=3364773 RepID=UPI0036D1A6A1